MSTLKNRLQLLAIGAFFVFLPGFVQAQPDTIIIRFGKKSHLDLHLAQRSDMDALKKLELNQLIRDIEKYLNNTDSLRGASVDTLENARGDDEEVVVRFRNITLREKSDGGVYAEINERETEKPEEEEKAFVVDLETDFGLNAFLHNGERPDDAPYYLRFWGSRYLATNLMAEFRLSQPDARTKVLLKTGLGVSWYNFMFERDVRIERQDGQVVFTPTDQDLIKSKLNGSYLNLPLMLQLGDEEKNIFALSVGGYAGVRLGSYTRVVYREDGDRVKDRERVDFFLSNFRYGLRTELNIGRKWGVTFFGNYDLNPVFRDNRGPDVQAVSFGVVF